MDNYSFCCSAEIDLNNRCCECGEEQKIVWKQENQNLKFVTLDEDFDSDESDIEVIANHFNRRYP
jgi:hypothetical protein